MQQGVCPICGSINLSYENVDFYDDQCFFPRRCKDCEAEGEERYSLEFIGHEEVREANSIEEKAHN